MKYLKKLTPIFLLITILGMPIGGMVSATMAMPLQNVIIVMDNYDPAIADAVNTLTAELDQYKLVQYGSFEYLWTAAFKSMKNAIFVGHGLEDEGVLLNNQLVDWQTFANVANSLQTVKIDFLICDSSQVSQYFSNNDKLGIVFENNIDATLGSLVISALNKIRMNHDVNSIFNNYYQKIMLRVTTIHKFPAKAHFLGVYLLDPGAGGGAPAPSPPPTPVCETEFVIRNNKLDCAGFTQNELMIHAIVVTLLVFAVLAPATAAYIGSQASYLTLELIALGTSTAAFSALLTMITTIIIAYEEYRRGDASALNFVSSLIQAVPSFIEVVGFMIIALGALRAIAVGTIWAAEKASIFAGTIAILVPLAVGVISASINELDSALDDWSD